MEAEAPPTFSKIQQLVWPFTRAWSVLGPCSPMPSFLLQELEEAQDEDLEVKAAFAALTCFDSLTILDIHTGLKTTAAVLSVLHRQCNLKVALKRCPSNSIDFRSLISEAWFRAFSLCSKCLSRSIECLMHHSHCCWNSEAGSTFFWLEDHYEAHRLLWRFNGLILLVELLLIVQLLCNPSVPESRKQWEIHRTSYHLMIILIYFNHGPYPPALALFAKCPRMLVKPLRLPTLTPSPGLKRSALKFMECSLHLLAQLCIADF